jgi:hypothetical protein
MKKTQLLVIPIEVSAMRLPRLRFTLRLMMVAVAALAVSSALGRCLLAMHYWSLAREYQRFAWGDGRKRLNESAYQVKLRAYYEHLSNKYSRAASQPWLPVDPDPPLPSHGSQP